MKKTLAKKGLVLCAGLGTRLRPLTLNYAKPALPVLGIPSVWFSAWHLKKELGLKEMAVNIGHAPKTLQTALEDKALHQKLEINFHISDESSQILGSSGVLWKLKDWVGSDRLFATNGDSIFYPDWEKMLAAHIQSKALMTLHVRAFNDEDGEFTHIEIDDAGKVKSLGSKMKKGTMFSGAYIIEPEVIKNIPAGVSDLKTTVFDPLIKQQKLFAFKESIPWFDTGTVASYAKTQFDLLLREPKFKELVELKMKQVEPGIWIPKEWQAKDLHVKAPAVLQGTLQQWLACSDSFGPRFIGIEPPGVKKKLTTRDAIVFDDLEVHL